MSGWIQLHRKLTDWEWYKDVNTCHLFIHLILSANHKDTKWRGEVIKAGQILTGRKELSVKTGLTERQIRTSLNRLKTTSEMTIKSTNKYSLITITNWKQYQEKNEKATSKVSIKRPASDQQTTTSNNINNKNNDNKITNNNNIKIDFESFWAEYGRIGSKEKAKSSYIKALKGGTTHEEIIRGHTRYANYCGKTEWYNKQHCSTWLNQEGWNSEWDVQIIESKTDRRTREHQEAAVRGMVRAEWPDF